MSPTPLLPPPGNTFFNGERTTLCAASNSVDRQQMIDNGNDARVMMMMMMMMEEEDEGLASKKRRLTVEQVRYLESSFKEDKKLEPERKVGIARHLGLQPRQVAIWFQNRRARLRSKQLERDYALLKSLYDVVASEKQKLQDEIDLLNKELRNIRSTKQDKERSCTDKQQSMNMLKCALQTQETSINEYNSLGDCDSPKCTKSSLLAITAIKLEKAAESAREGAIRLRMTKDRDGYNTMATNLSQSMSVNTKAEDHHQLMYPTNQSIEGQHNCLKLHHWHDIWSD